MQYALLAVSLLFVACTSDSERKPATPTTPFSVSSAQRGSLRAVDSLQLGENAHITGLVPERDGDGVAFTFTDPEQRVNAGLGFIDRQHDRAQLVWPDSVTNVWWPTLHRLAFTSSTGRGVYVVVDVHAATLEVVSDTSAPSTRSPVAVTAPNEDAAGRTRAVQYIDSLHLQLGGQPERGALHYIVAQMVAAPADSMAAFYVVATDTAGTRFNPSWYMLDLQTGQARPVDSLTARAESMPVRAAAWDASQHFFYAKDKALYEVRVIR